MFPIARYLTFLGIVVVVGGNGERQRVENTEVLMSRALQTYLAAYNALQTIAW